MISEQEITLARRAMATALECGAEAARVRLDSSICSMVDTLDGSIDKVSSNIDRSLTISIYADGRFGNFSTNRLEEASLRKFVADAVATTKMIAPDPCRGLPDETLFEKGAVTGEELGLRDSSYDSISFDDRKQIALKAACRPGTSRDGWTLVSEDGEYSDSDTDCIIMNTKGLWCRHRETSFEYASQVTIKDGDGTLYSGVWWHAAPVLSDLEWRDCGAKAIGKAAAQMHPTMHKSDKTNMVVDCEVASKLLSPIINALNGGALQQKSSFLCESLGKKVFGEGMTLVDDCRKPGVYGSQLFDAEGMATSEAPIIEGGTIKKYFLNTTIARKMNMAPTNDDCTRPRLMPWPEAGLKQEDALQLCGEGILVTGFVGGNSNIATGDFSYGIEGFAFSGGRITGPVCPMVVTGNFTELWSNLLAVCDDSRGCTSRIVPTIAFRNVSLSGNQ